MITLALSKGRIFDETLPLLAAAGIEVLEDPEKSRKLILPTNLPNVRVALVIASRSATISATFKAFRTSGRFRVMVATAPSTW